MVFIGFVSQLYKISISKVNKIDDFGMELLQKYVQLSQRLSCFRIMFLKYFNGMHNWDPHIFPIIGFYELKFAVSESGLLE